MSWNVEHFLLKNWEQRAGVPYFSELSTQNYVC